jgi:hypothetical protein
VEVSSGYNCAFHALMWIIHALFCEHLEKEIQKLKKQNIISTKPQNQAAGISPDERQAACPGQDIAAECQNYEGIHFEAYPVITISHEPCKDRDGSAGPGCIKLR